MSSLNTETPLAHPDERAELAAELCEQREHDLPLTVWYLKVLAECEFMEDRIKEQAEKMLSAITARRRALEWRFGREFREMVERDLAQQKGKKKRSVEYLTGRAGFRTLPGKVFVQNKEELVNWCAINLPKAVPMEPVLHVTPIMEHFDATGEIPPGCDILAKRDKFYPSTGEKEQIGGTQERTNGLPDESGPASGLATGTGSTEAPPEAGA